MKFIAMIIATIAVAFSMPTFAELPVYDTIVDSDFLHSEYDQHESIYSIVLADNKGGKDKSFKKAASNDDSNNDTGANAGGGGKVKNPWQPVDPDLDVCSAFLPAGLDLDSCTELATTTSGKTYLCGTLGDYVVYCPD